MGIFILWIFFAIIVGIIGSGRKVGFFGAFLASVILSPLIGIIIVFASQRNSDALFQKKLLESSKTKTSNPSEEIDRLLDMKSKGAISENEYQRMKAKIIDNI